MNLDLLDNIHNSEVSVLTENYEREKKELEKKYKNDVERVKREYEILKSKINVSFKKEETG